MIKKLTAQRLREIVDYDPETGIMRRRISTSSRAQAGDTIGTKLQNGYMAAMIDRRMYLVHRLAWFHVTGEWPEQIDHADGNPANNAFANLRLATISQNRANSAKPKNNTAGRKGVTWDSCRNKFRANIRKDGKYINLGRFDTAEEAANAYARAAVHLFGDFARA